eukprot:365707-Chlamydomonas_euryale.AAC.9
MSDGGLLRMLLKNQGSTEWRLEQLGALTIEAAAVTKPHAQPAFVLEASCRRCLSSRQAATGVCPQGKPSLEGGGALAELLSSPSPFRAGSSVQQGHAHAHGCCFRHNIHALPCSSAGAQRRTEENLANGHAPVHHAPANNRPPAKEILTSFAMPPMETLPCVPDGCPAVSFRSASSLRPCWETVCAAGCFAGLDAGRPQGALALGRAATHLPSSSDGDAETLLHTRCHNPFACAGTCPGGVCSTLGQPAKSAARTAAQGDLIRCRFVPLLGGKFTIKDGAISSSTPSEIC